YAAEGRPVGRRHREPHAAFHPEPGVERYPAAMPPGRRGAIYQDESGGRGQSRAHGTRRRRLGRNEPMTAAAVLEIQRLTVSAIVTLAPDRSAEEQEGQSAHERNTATPHVLSFLSLRSEENSRWLRLSCRFVEPHPGFPTERDALPRRMARGGARPIHWHRESTQRRPGAQIFPQAPQFLPSRSICVSQPLIRRPSQSAVPAKHRNTQSWA